MPLLSRELEAAFPAWDDSVPYKEMELKMVSGSNTERLHITTKDTRRENLNRLK